MSAATSLLDALDEQLFGQMRHGEPRRALVEARGIGLGAEARDAAVGQLVGLEALEDFLRIMEHRRRRIERDRLARTQYRIVPALTLGVADRHHMIGEQRAEAQARHGGGAVARPMSGQDEGRVVKSSMSEIFLTNFYYDNIELLMT